MNKGRPRNHLSLGVKGVSRITRISRIIQVFGFSGCSQILYRFGCDDFSKITRLPEDHAEMKTDVENIEGLKLTGAHFEIAIPEKPLRPLRAFLRVLCARLPLAFGQGSCLSRC